ncbi:toll/interleukin-1 receptor domain-containing protein [uncultured Methanobrevibacter sp.]|uniref:toll/interleukin-1 receptor domain-containing protein n=1 Tax=uncultured Methanobrevibacter sp. TaxID=253161 RepID=UPI00261E7571|nr:toll/interleukin-1 receptor domain-containing protein [uncultured Methanobrevibacter sp.]
MAHDIFISYSTKDKQTADAICHVLEQNGLKCWIAPRNIASGENYAKEIMDGLKAAKIVVLVFSKNSQESEFVNNEIDAAFRNNKSIISFKIDETLPENKMEFFLKNKHWLEAYPNPESVFERLVKDALRLCDEEYNKQIVIDNSENSKSVSNKLPTRRKDLASIILLFTPIYSFAYIYMGYVAKEKEWLAWGVILFIPLILLLWAFGLDNGETFRHAGIVGNSMILFFIFWALAFIIGVFFVRKEFLARKTVLSMMPQNDERYESLVEEYMRI